MKALILAALLVAATDDIPVNGDHMAVVFQSPTEIFAIDTRGARDESDGSHSVIAYVMKRQDDGNIVRIAGRLAFKCHSHQWRAMSRYLLDADGKVTETDATGTAYEVADPDSVAALALSYVCQNTTTADL